MKRSLIPAAMVCSISIMSMGCASSDKDVEEPNRVAEDAAVLETEAEAGVPEASARDGAPPRVAMETSLGRIVIELYPDEAPITVANFLNYVDKGYYEGLIFHRIIPTFMIQGGGFTPGFEKQEQGLDSPIENEAANGLPNKRGTIAMARTGDPHSATSQFFINVADNPALNYREKTPQGWGYCVFGRVVEGMEVVDAIKNAQTRQSRAMPHEQSEPVVPPVIEKVERVTP